MNVTETFMRDPFMKKLACQGRHWELFQFITEQVVEAPVGHQLCDICHGKIYLSTGPCASCGNRGYVPLKVTEQKQQNWAAGFRLCYGEIEEKLAWASRNPAAQQQKQQKQGQQK